MDIKPPTKFMSIYEANFWASIVDTLISEHGLKYAVQEADNAVQELNRRAPEDMSE